MGGWLLAEAPVGGRRQASAAVFGASPGCLPSTRRFLSGGPSVSGVAAPKASVATDDGSGVDVTDLSFAAALAFPFALLFFSGAVVGSWGPSCNTRALDLIEFPKLVVGSRGRLYTLASLRLKGIPRRVIATRRERNIESKPPAPTWPELREVAVVVLAAGALEQCAS
jgi:hypothetical protein